MKKLLPFLIFIVANFGLNAQCTTDWIFDDTDLTIQFTDLSVASSGDIVDWFWDFDDGTTSSEQHPLHTFPAPDKYDVELTITTSTGCTDNLKIRIEICEFSISVAHGSCNASNEIPLTITVNDLYDNAKEIDITVDGTLVPGSPFPIEQAAPVTVTVNVPGDGLGHTINVQSTDIPTCNEEIVTVVEDCGSNCFLSALDVNFSGGFIHTVIVGPGGNNSFSPATATITISDLIRFEWQDDGHSTTSDATSGPDSWNSGVIGIGSIFDVSLTNPGIHGYYCIPHGGPGGAGMSGTIVANCPAGNNFDLDVTFNTTQANPGGFNLLIDGVVQPGSPHTYNGTGPQLVIATLAGDGASHVFKIEDVDDPTCFIETNFTAPDCGAAPQCQLTLTAEESGPCNTNNEVPVDVTVNAINPGNQGFNIAVDGVTVPGGPFTYNTGGPTVVTIDVAGDGQSHTITATDVADPTCTGSATITTTNCAIPCSLTNLTTSTGNPQTHVVLVEDFFFSPQHVTITSGDVVEWQWTGAVQHTSTSDAASGPDSWDSGLLSTGATFTSPALSTGIHPYYCIPHGGPGGAGMSGTVTVQANCTNGMVPVTITFDESGGGFAGFNVKVDGTVTPGSPYTYDPSGTNTVTVDVPGDGMSHAILVEDVDDPACNVSTNIVTPNCSGPTCQLTVTAEESGPCDANNQVPVDVTVTDIGGGTDFEVYVDGNLAGTFPYNPSGNTTVTVNITGNGQSHTIEVKDVDDPTCSATTSITTTNCAIPCEITNLTASTGNSQTHVVTVEDFFFSPQNITITAGDMVEWQWTGAVAHTSTSDASSGPDSWDSGLLNTGATYTSPVLSTGVHGYYCIPHGGPGGAGMAGTVTVVPDCNNNMVSVSVTFDESGGSFNGFRVLVDGTAVDTLTYEPSGSNAINVSVQGDGQSHTIAIEDLDDPNCTATISIVTPDCNFTPVCDIQVTALQAGTCTNDSIEVELNITAQNAGTSFNLYIDGTAYSGNPVNYNSSCPTVLNVLVPGDGQSHAFKVEDTGNTACNDTANLIVSNCSTPCSLSNLMLEAGGNGGGITHTVEVKDFEFTPKDITVTTGDIVHWVWTGGIPHTTTSDATSGPVVWDSGLLSNGATFDVTISETGIHPYYCIPHGGPGGAGMAGTITADPPCDNGQVSVTITFEATNGGNSGYNVKVDGSIVPGSPFTYSGSGNNSVTVDVPGDGQSHAITIIDADDPACTVSGNITTPNCGGGGGGTNCSLEIVAGQVGDCNSNNQVEVELTITYSNTGASGFNLKVGGNLVPGSPFDYDPSGTTVMTIPVTGTGQNRTIIVEDIDSIQCTAQTQILTPQCGPECEMIDLAVPGEPVRHIVEVRDFDFFPDSLDIVVGDTVEFLWTGVVEHTTTSDATSGDNSWDSGLLGTGAVFEVIITETGHHPYYCIPHGGPGGIGMAGNINALDTCTDMTGTANLAVSFEVTNGSALGYDVFVDGEKIEEGPFQYTNQMGINTVVIQTAGDGGQHLLTVQDLDVSYCAATIPFTTPDCPVLCLIENLEAHTGSGIVHDVLVTDFDYEPNDLTLRTGETVHFYWTGTIPHSTTSDVNSGPDSWNSGIHGAGFEFDVVLSNPGDHPYYCIPHGGPGGIGQSGVIHALADCENGEVSVQLNFTITDGSPAGFNVFMDGQLQPGSPFPYDDPTGANSVTITVPGDGQLHNFSIQDTEVNFCAATTQLMLPDCNADCEISGLEVNFAQPTAHTVEVADFEFLPKDITITLGDTVHFIWTGSVAHTATSDATTGPDSFDSGLLGQGAEFDVVLQNVGGHPYYCIPHGGPGGIGMAGTITVETGGCDNGMVTADLTFHATNGGSGYNIFVDNILQSGSPFSYDPTGDNLVQISLPGDGLAHVVRVNDADDPDCSAEITLSTPDCGGNCDLVITAEQDGDCNGSDEVPYLLTIHSSNAGDSFNILVDGNPLPGNPFNYETGGSTLINIELPGDGMDYTIEAVDNDSLDCNVLVVITTPDCDPDCQLTATTLQTGGCENGEVMYDLTVDVQNGSTSFELTLDGVPYPGSPFSYTGGLTTVAIALPGDGLAHELIVADSGSPDCQDVVSLTTPDCASGCTLADLVIEIGIPVVHVVEVRDFDFFPQDLTVVEGDTVRFIWTGDIPHTATTYATSGPDAWNSGLLGQGAVFEVVMQEQGVHDYYCIPHEGMGMIGSINVVGGCDDGELPVRLSFDASNGGTGYNLFLDGNLLPGSPFPYDISGHNVVEVTVPGAGQSVAIIIEDASEPGCNLTTTIQVPDCNDPCFGFEAAWDAAIDHTTLEVQFNDISGVQADSHFWTFGDTGTSNQEHPVYTYDEPGEYEVCLTLEQDACSSTFCSTIIIGEYQCEANFSYEMDGLTIHLTDASVTTETATEWMWDLGDNHFIAGEKNTSYTYEELGIYTVCLTIGAGQCEDDTCMVIDLSDPCLLFQPDFVFTVDESTLTVQFIDQTSGDPNQWLWGFGDSNTSNSQNPEHSYDEPGAYNVCLLVQDTETGCNATYCEVIGVGVTGTVEIDRRNFDVVVYPNPSSPDNYVWTIEGILPEDNGRLLDLKLYDMQGKTILETTVPGREQIIFSSPQTLTRGIHFLELQTDDGRYYRGRIVVQ